MRQSSLSRFSPPTMDAASYFAKLLSLRTIFRMSSFSIVPIVKSYFWFCPRGRSGGGLAAYWCVSPGVMYSSGALQANGVFRAVLRPPESVQVLLFTGDFRAGAAYCRALAHGLFTRRLSYSVVRFASGEAATLFYTKCQRPFFVHRMADSNRRSSYASFPGWGRPHPATIPG